MQDSFQSLHIHYLPILTTLFFDFFLFDIGSRYLNKRSRHLFERFFTGSGSVGGLVVGNPNLEPESGVNFDTGVKFRNSKFADSVTYFNNTYRNFLTNILIDQIIASPVELFQTQNVGRARIQGFEADAEFPIKIGLGFLTPSGNISYLRGDDLETNEPLDFITPLKTVLNIRWTSLITDVTQ
jgi:hemoglobin/transferrin/lactoferrin receptor protein